MKFTLVLLAVFIPTILGNCRHCGCSIKTEVAILKKKQEDSPHGARTSAVVAGRPSWASCSGTSAARRLGTTAQGTVKELQSPSPRITRTWTPCAASWRWWWTRGRGWSCSTTARWPAGRRVKSTPAWEPSYAVLGQGAGGLDTQRVAFNYWQSHLVWIFDSA